MGDGFEPVGTGVLPGKYREYTGYGFRCRRIVGPDQGMGMRGAQRYGIGLIRKVEIIAVTAMARQEA
jgi:hypothetical protein